MRSCSRTFARRSVRTSMMPESPRASARSSAARHPGRSSTRSCASPYNDAAASESGPVGWTDATGDGEFCVALRCALLRGAVARCYAGNGIVRESDPAAELAETEIKLAALLPLLAS